MTDIVERLRNHSRGDHERLCQGREYVCCCGYDDANEKAAEEAADLITRLRSELASAREDADILRKKALQWRAEYRAEAEEHAKAIADRTDKATAWDYVQKARTDARAEAFEQAAQIADRYAVDAEKQAATAADGVAHDALLMASDFCELLAGELREQAIRKASGESA